MREIIIIKVQSLGAQKTVYLEYFPGLTEVF